MLAGDHDKGSERPSDTQLTDSEPQEHFRDKVKVSCSKAERSECFRKILLPVVVSFICKARDNS